MLYAYFMSKDLKEKGVKVDITKVLVGALLHDLDETITGDIMRPFKYSDEEIREKIESLGRTLLHTSLLKITDDDMALELLEEFDWRHFGPEGRIIKVADVASVIAWAWREVKFGNQHAHTLVEECMDGFWNLDVPYPELREIRDTIYATFLEEFRRLGVELDV